MTLRATAALDVYKGPERVGTLERTAHGARFAYLPDYVAAHRDAPLAAVAFSLPVRADAYEVHGTNVHPFFAGLLPEGLRLRALVRAMKTSEDDLFTLLTASGADAVGDVYVAPQGEPPLEHAPLADLKHLADTSFDDLFERSLVYDEDRREPSIAGVHPKLSAAMISLPLRAADPRRKYILKLTPDEYPKLAENEAFFMALAKRCGLTVARTQLVHDRNGRGGLLVERFDRVPAKTTGVQRVHQEDGCQLLDRYPADKYRLDLADVSGALEICSAPLPERLALLRLQALSYAIANGDLHAKNVSIQVTGTRIHLTPAYDLLSTLPYGDARMALAMEGRDAQLKAAHFFAFGERIGIRRPAIARMLTTLCTKLAPALTELSAIGLPPKQTQHLERVMRERLTALAPS